MKVQYLYITRTQRYKRVPKSLLEASAFGVYLVSWDADIKVVGAEEVIADMALSALVRK